MNTSFGIIGGAFLLLFAAFTNKDKRAEILSDVKNKIDWGSPVTSPVTNDGGFNKTIFDNVDVVNLPKSGQLSENEVKALATYVVKTYGFLVGDKTLTAMAYIESSYKPAAVRHERRRDGSIWDSSYGLMQTLVGTAQDMWSKGYKAFDFPTSETLTTPLVSMYFGAAYVDWLMKNYPNHDLEWYVRAYNGGPGWERTTNGPTNTANHFAKFADVYKRFSVTVTFG